LSLQLPSMRVPKTCSEATVLPSDMTAANLMGMQTAHLMS